MRTCAEQHTSKLHAAPSDAKSKVPDQSGPLPAHSLHVDLLCSSHLCGEGLPWAAFCGRDYYVCLRTGIYDGQVRSSPRQVHGLLHDVSRSLFWSWFSKCFWLIHTVVSNSKHPSDVSQSFLRIFWVYTFKTNGWNWPCGEGHTSNTFRLSRFGVGFTLPFWLEDHSQFINSAQNYQEMLCQRMWTLLWPPSRLSVPFNSWTGILPELQVWIPKKLLRLSSLEGSTNETVLVRFSLQVPDPDRILWSKFFQSRWFRVVEVVQVVATLESRQWGACKLLRNSECKLMGLTS